MKKTLIFGVIFSMLATSALAEFYLAPGGAIRPDGALAYGVPATPHGPFPGLRAPIYSGHLGPFHWMSYPVTPVPVNVAPTIPLNSQWEDGGELRP